ncbi:pollen-specific leucine-rich repeat extensin-like protein 2 [Manduca sexta]|uniref:pollen-specific leucine-rich repeat extensin-like protein 2 n=1 Tax=Manduca sexta TaxID=7130 RepID=UPI00188F9C0F|nr:pollen-specific leucine-rich repeat extensin-like protein 2 [Manduca sexta]
MTDATKVASPPKKEASPPKHASSPTKEVLSPPLSAASWKKEASPPKEVVSPPLSSRREEIIDAPRTKNVTPLKKDPSPPKNQRSSSLIKSDAFKIASSPTGKANGSPPKMMNMSPPMVKSPPLSRDDPTPPTEKAISPPKKNNSPPSTVFKNVKTDLKEEENTITRTLKRENSIVREAPPRAEKLSLVATEVNTPIDKNENQDDATKNEQLNKSKDEESNGVGDKIRKFEKAAEDASASAGRLSRPGSVRGRSRDESSQPATPFKEAAHFDLVPHNSVNSVAARWQRNEIPTDVDKPRAEPQKIIKPEFKPLSSPAEVTIRSPSLGAKIADRFPSHGTAFRNVASPDPARPREPPKFEEDGPTANDFRSCKFRNKERHSVSKGSSYFTRGSEEIWLVKKKDIEEIEERVLDSFRRAGGALCVRSESSRSAHEAGSGPAAAAVAAAAVGGTLRGRRHGYARSESLDPQWAGARAHTLKRQASVACTCGHDKKTRAKPGGEAVAAAAARPRSRSHGDENEQAHVLDKYETLV